MLLNLLRVMLFMIFVLHSNGNNYLSCLMTQYLQNGLTPMHLAAQEDRVQVAEILIKHGSATDTSTKAGYTPLHTACHFGQVNMVRFLLDHEASVNATTKVN